MEHTKGEMIAETKISDLGEVNPRVSMGIKGGPILFHTAKTNPDHCAKALEFVRRWNRHDELQAKADSHNALLAVLKRIADECFEAMEGAGLPEFENYGCWMNIAKQAIAKNQ